MDTDFIEWEVQVVKYRPPGGGMWWRLLSVGTSPYGRGTYGYAHSPLRGVRPPGTETPVYTKALGTQKPPGTKRDEHGDRWGKVPDYEEMGTERDEHGDR